MTARQAQDDSHDNNGRAPASGSGIYDRINQLDRESGVHGVQLGGIDRRLQSLEDKVQKLQDRVMMATGALIVVQLALQWWVQYHR